MRTKLTSMVAALLLVSAGAAAQDAASLDTVQKDVPKASVVANPDIPLVNQVEFGMRGTVFGAGSDQARFQRYRDVRDGGTLDRLRVYKDTDVYRYSLQADNVGYRDQRYSASYLNYGKVNASFEWNQIPLFYKIGRAHV